MRSGVIELVMIPPGGSVRPDGGDRGRPATTTSWPCRPGAPWDIRHPADPAVDARGHGWAV